MKKIGLCALVGVVLAAWASAQPETIQYIQIQQTSSATAQYTATDGKLDWSGGGFNYIYTESGQFWTFDSADLGVQFSRYSDDSSGGVAKARFDLLGSWSVSMYKDSYGTDAVVIISGNMNGGGGFGGRYWEEESSDEAFEGKAWLNIVSVWADSDWLAAEVDGTLQWDDDLIAGLETDVDLDAGIGDLTNYSIDYTAGNGLTATLWADQGKVVPEPATMILLGLGGLLLRKRRA